MKKVIYLIVLFLSMLFTLKTQAQTSFTTSPNGGQCYSPSSNYGYAGFNNTITAQSFSWAVAGPGGCNASYTTSSSGGPPYISIYYPCCGIYTITCYAFTGSAVATYTQTYQIFCANSISVSGTSTLCTSGTAYLNATSSTNYTNYFWQPGGLIGDSISVNLSSTTCFTVTGVTANGCTNSTVKCVTVQPGGVGINGGNSAICSGSYAILTATGATSYTWLPSGTVGSSLIVTPGSTTCYTVQGYNASCGGISTAVKCVTVIPSPTVSVSGNTAVCGGSSTTLTASGASTYTWMYGSSPLTGSVVVITPTASTCFSLLALNQNGCYGVSGVCLNPQGGLNLSVSGNTTICGGTSSTLTASGAQNYTWNPGGFTGSSIVVSPSVSACYTVTGTNSVGCSGSVAICVNVQSSSSVIIQGPSTLCAGSSATLFGSGGTSYTWNPGNIVNNGQLVITPSVNTCYSMTTNSYCGLVTVVRCVTVSTTNGSLTISGPSNLCAGYNATLNAFGANSYTWYPGGSTAPLIVASPTAPICYTVIGTGCAGTLSASHCLSVTPNPVISVTGSTFVCPGSTGTLTASGATSYTWYGSNATYTGSTIVFTANATSCFSVMGTNGNGCYGYGGICVTPQSPLSVSGATSLCSGNSATLVASGSASGYTWMPGGMTGSVVVVSPTASICYTVTSTNTAGCNGYAVHCIQVNPKPIISVYPTATLCIGQPAGLFASGASSYTWLPSGATGSSIAITPTASSCYTVIGLNTWGCTNTAVNCFSAYPAATVTISGSNVNCSGQSTTLTASGATNYYWMPGGLSGSVIVVSPTASVCYTVTGYPSGQMCPGTAVRCMSVLPAPIVSVSGNTSICAGSSANLSASGAQTYTWIPGNLTGSLITVSPTVSTCYTVVGTGASGCIGVNNICVNIKPKPSIYTASGFFCAGQPDTLSAFGASTYTWLPFNLTGPNIVISPSVSGCYTVIGTNTAGCTNTTTGCYSVAPIPNITVSGNNAVCAGGSTTLTATGATSYFWSPGGFTGSSIVVSPSVNTCYTVTGYNAYGCSNKTVKCVSVQPGAVISISGNNVLCGGSSANLIASGAASYTWSNGMTGPFITVSPSVSTCYSVIGQTSGGCTGMAVKCITVQNIPFLTVTGNTNICQGSSATLQASGAASYWWNTGATSSAIVVSPNVSTSYMVIGSNGACQSSINVNVTVRPKPFVFILGGDSTMVCAGDALTLTAVGASTYTWNNSSTGSMITVTPTASTVYSVVGTSTNNCTNSAAKLIVVNACTGISANTMSESDVQIYPNPSSGLVTISNQSAESLNVKVYDMIGRELLKKQINGTQTLDLSNYANGTYIVRFEKGNKTLYKKLIIE